VAPRTESAIASAPRALSLVIPTWNGGTRFARLLELLAQQDVPGGFQLVVIDSGSRDGTRERARAAGALVLEVPQAEFNHGRTRNRAIAASSGECVALLTQDALPLDASYLRVLASACAQVDGAYARQFPQPDCDPILAERLRRWSASRTQPARQSLVPGDAVASAARFASLPPMERYLACAFDNVASCVRRSSWERQPFPERSFGEDVAWARATLLAGGTIAFEPGARVEHSHRISIRREFKRLYCDHRNLAELFELRTVPEWSSIPAGWAWGRRTYADLLAAQPLSALQRLGWRAYSIPYALAEPTAQFLGARSLEQVPRSRFWAWLDRKLRAHV
jgi:rhamnosyltransferase